LEASKIPPGVVNLVIGDSERILNCWLSNSKVNDIVYFGDSHTGLEIGSRIYASGKKPILELSGNDTMVVWKDADLENAATSLVQGFLGSMQICMAARRAVVHPAVYDKFEAIVLSKVQTISAGLPNEEQTHLAAVGKIEEFYEFLLDALRHGAQLIYGGTRIDHTGSPNPRGMFLTPAVLRIEKISKAEAMKCTTEEGFFPLLTLIKVSWQSLATESDETIFTKMLNFLEKNAYGLRTSIWTESAKYKRMFIENVHNSGLLRINVSHTGFSALVGTHGGPGRSGGPFGELNYLWEKTSHLQGVCLKGKKRKSNKKDGV
jgi:acyl-CoA reductase-like NAD-dependent aldehyde dehydrogenase